MPIFNDKKFKMHVLAITTIFLWSFNYVFTRIAVRYYPPESFAFLRYAVASFTLLAYAFIKKVRPPVLRDVPLFFFGGAIGFAFYIYLFNTGTQFVAASVASFINSSAPVITVVFARIFLKEKISGLGWASAVCAFAGVGIITLSGGAEFNLGGLWILGGAMLFSGYSIFQRKLLLHYKPLEITTYCIIAGGIMLSVFAHRSLPYFLTAPPVQILAVVFTGVFPAAIAYVCWANALSHADKTNEVTNYLFILPILTTILGFIIINEVPGASVYIGGGVVILSVLGVNLQNKYKIQVESRDS